MPKERDIERGKGERERDTKESKKSIYYYDNSSNIFCSSKKI
jgi:hypothetical protein